MKIRSSLLLAATAALSLGTLAPAQAADTDPVTDPAASAVQLAGSELTWKVTASWTANPDFSGLYTVQVVDDCAAPETTYAAGDTTDPAQTTKSFTVQGMAGGTSYCVRIFAKGVSGATKAVAPFDTPEADTAAPNGSYRLNRTSGYLALDFEAEDLDEVYSAAFRITQVQAGDDVTSRKVIAGDGSATKNWAGGQTFDLRYTKTGSFKPRVLIADKYGNTTAISLPVVHVLDDRSKPKVKIIKPAKPAKASSWRVIRGTASDRGSGVEGVVVLAMEKRGAYWWAYDARHHKWLKGSKSRAKTSRHTKAWPLQARVRRNGRWHTATIKGLRPGTLNIQAVAFDNVFNVASAHPVTRRVH